MSPAELATVARAAGIASENGQPAPTVEAIVQRLGHLVGSDGRDATAVERECLRAIGAGLHVDVAPDAPPAAVESKLFGPLLLGAAQKLRPFWRIGAHMVALNARSVRQDGLELLERIAWRVLPSADAAKAVREAIHAIPEEGRYNNGNEMAEQVRPDVASVAPHLDWIEPTLMLCLVLGCSDTKFNREEERLYNAVAHGLGVTVQSAQALKDRTTATFWSRRARLAPRNTENPAEVRANSLQAAYDTLEHTGTFGAFTDMVCASCNGHANGTGKQAWPMRMLASLTGRKSAGAVLPIALMAYVREQSAK